MSDFIERSVKIYCTQCGGDQFIQPDNPRSEDTITCHDCGATFVVSELQEVAARTEAKKLADELVRAAFGKSGK